MAVYSTLVLDQDNDFLLACDDGYDTVAVIQGAEAVAQSAAIAVSTKRGSVWYNLYAGFAYEGVFVNSGRNDGEMAGIRATALRQALFAIPGIVGFDEGSSITFTRKGRSLVPSIPCLLINCENSRTRGFIEVLEQ